MLWSVNPLQLLKRRFNCALLLFDLIPILIPWRQLLFWFRKSDCFTMYRLAVLVWTKKVLKSEHFDNDDVTIITWFAWPSFTERKSKMTGDCYVFKFIQRVVDEKYLMRFQSEISVHVCFQVPPVWCGQSYSQLVANSIFRVKISICVQVVFVI